MKKNLISTIYIVATLLLVSCAGKTEGPANEVLSKKVYNAVMTEYDKIYDFSCGVAIADKGDNEYIIDTKGKVVLSLDSNKESLLSDTFSDGLIPVIKESGVRSVVGYLNTKGEEAIPFEYRYGTDFFEGTALVLKNNKVYNIDKNGEVIGEEKSKEIILDFLDDAEWFIEVSDDLVISLVGEDMWYEEW